MKKFCTIGTALSTLLLCFAATAGNSCIECHSNQDFYARFPKLYHYYQDWIESPHHHNGVTCDDCHDGNPKADVAQAAHEGIFPVSNRKSSLHFSRQPTTCGACHHDKQAEFEQSKHFRALKTETDAAPTCTTCHPAMNKRPTYHSIVLNACTICHQADNRQGLPEIVDEAENLLRNINVAQGMIGWAGLHFESQGWPGTSRHNMQLLEQRYANIVDQVHRFDLQTSDEETLELLNELKKIFDEERRASSSGN
jgi:hypothetical protein